MAPRNRRGGPSRGYVFQFAGTAALLVSGTLALVLYVLPERYVLSSGFREGNLYFPIPRTPFEPAPPLRIAAVRSTPMILPAARPDSVVRGPAELFWERVLPLLEAGRYAAALPLFTDYLAAHPGDVGVRRQHAITLAAAGRPERAIPILEGLLAHEDDDGLHLLLARTLRDVGRVEAAAEHYALLLDRRADDTSLALEWARALSWMEDYAGAEAVLLRGLEADPGSASLRSELVRVRYYAGPIEEADGPPPPPPSLLEQAVEARESHDLARADSLFSAALDEAPASVEIRQAYADFLQYEAEDFDAALDALREVERLRDGRDAALQYRMALLEIWTDRTEAAGARLEALLDGLETDDSSVSVADVLALLGDLRRWRGERLAAVRRYEAALAEEPRHEGASEGLSLLRAEVDRLIVESEEPGVGAVASTFADTDDFRRLDAGGRWRGVHRDWVWATRTGGRWVEGLEPGGGRGTREGLFAELDGGRWWRWGTIRTAAHLDIQNVRSSSADVGVGGSARLVATSGRRTDVRFDHEPAYPVTNTLQSVAADVWQDRLTLSHGQPLSERWSAAVDAEVASLEHRELAGADRNLRLQVAASLNRVVSSTVSLGLSARALGYRDAAPTGAALALYWDPSASISVGPYLRYTRPLGAWWRVTARANPGLSFIDERRGADSEVVPDLSAGLGIVREGAKYRTRVELFYGQGRFTGYRSFGVDLSFVARGWMGPGGEP